MCRGKFSSECARIMYNIARLQVSNPNNRSAASVNFGSRRFDARINRAAGKAHSSKLAPGAAAPIRSRAAAVTCRYGLPFDPRCDSTAVWPLVACGGWVNSFEWQRLLLQSCIIGSDVRSIPTMLEIIGIAPLPTACSAYLLALFASLLRLALTVSPVDRSHLPPHRADVHWDAFRSTHELGHFSSPHPMAAPSPVVKQYDFVVIGSGIAGLTYALKVAQYGRVAVITKDFANEGCTQYAQGGVCAVLDSADSVSNHVRDTVVAGAHLNDQA